MWHISSTNEDDDDDDDGYDDDDNKDDDSYKDDVSYTVVGNEVMTIILTIGYFNAPILLLFLDINWSCGFLNVYKSIFRKCVSAARLIQFLVFYRFLFPFIPFVPLAFLWYSGIS